MDNDLEQKIRERAYAIWEREGQSGNSDDHWQVAEREVGAAPEGAIIGSAEQLPTTGPGGPSAKTATARARNEARRSPKL